LDGVLYNFVDSSVEIIALAWERTGVGLTPHAILLVSSDLISSSLFNS
jgi:hypothetical protein